MKHWAHNLIGRPYTATFRCWDLVRHVFETRFGVTMPEHAAGVLNLKTAATVSGWRKVDTIAQPDDIVLMRTGRTGERHVGVFIEADGKCGVLHNDGHLAVDGTATGCVGFNTLAELQATGATEFEFWRSVL